jgi:surface antigen
MTPVSDETLMAFADGALDDAEMEAVAEAVSNEPLLAQKLERMMQTNQLLHAAYDGPMREAVPKSLVDAVRPAPDFAALQARAANENSRWPRWAALAATLLVGALLGSQFSGAVKQQAQTDETILASAAMQNALENSASLEKVALGGGESLTPQLSFQSGDKRFCRQFLLRKNDKNQQGIACRDTKGWSIAALMPAHAAGQAVGGYATASGETDSALDDFMTRLGAQDPLDARAEKKLIAKAWRE